MRNDMTSTLTRVSLFWVPIEPNDAIPVQVLQPPLRARARCHLTLNHVSIATTI
jgi:hypothetical protein